MKERLPAGYLVCEPPLVDKVPADNGEAQAYVANLHRAAMQCKTNMDSIRKAVAE